MKYKWIDYTVDYAPIIESWIDSDARKYTGCDDGWDNYFEYWKNFSGTKIGENFWAKVIFNGNTPFAVMAISLQDGTGAVCEYIIDPLKRGKGYGSSALIELMTFGTKIIGHEILFAEAVIFPSNIPSQKVFEKAGYVFDHADPDGDVWYYKYQKAMRCFFDCDCTD